jgi:hypothetical protein
MPFMGVNVLFSRTSHNFQGGTHQVNEENVIHRVGIFNVEFGNQSLSSRSGMVLIKDFIDRLDVAQTIDAEISFKQRRRGYSESETLLGLIYNLLAGGDCLDDLEVLRGDGGTLQLLGVTKLLAPTTAGDALRKFDIGSIHDLHRTNAGLQQKVRAQQTSDHCTIDVDASVYEQASKSKEGSTKAYNGEIGYHPIFAFWDEESELLFSHLCRGSVHPESKFKWFMRETLKRVPESLKRRLRTDSAFYSRKVVEICETNQITFAITADQTKRIINEIEAIEESQWEDLERYGVAQVAEFRYQPRRWEKAYRYVVKREVALDKKAKAYFRYHVVVTNDEERSAQEMIEWHLGHSNVENRIKEHKSGFGLEKLPTRSFAANWAYLLIGQIAFNLMAWFKKMVLPEEYHRATIKTIRHQILNVAGKVVGTGRKKFLKISEKYRYQDVWQFAMKRLAELT